MNRAWILPQVVNKQIFNKVVLVEKGITKFLEIVEGIIDKVYSYIVA